MVYNDYHELIENVMRGLEETIRQETNLRNNIHERGDKKSCDPTHSTRAFSNAHQSNTHRKEIGRKMKCEDRVMVY